MAFTFTTAEQQSRDSGLKCLVYGPSGMGKTMLCATLPAPLLLSAESGLLSLKRKNIEKVYGVDTPGISYDIPVVVVKTYEDLLDVYQFLLTPDAAGVRSVCLDSISEIAEVVLSNLKRSAKDSRQAYGEMMEKVMDLVRKFRDLPGKNVYFSAKQEAVKDELTGAQLYGPSMPGTKLGPGLPYYFDEVFRLGMQRQQDGSIMRFLQTQPDMQYVAKDRSGALDALEPPHLGYLLNKIHG